MDKKQEIRSQIAVRQTSISHFQAEIDVKSKEVADLQAELEAMKVPELRHGDLRLYEEGDWSAIGIVDMSEPALHILWDEGDLRNSLNSKDDTLRRSIHIGTLTEVFADIKMLSEPLSEFELDDSNISVRIAPSGSLRITQDEDDVYIPEKLIVKFSNNLRRMIAMEKGKK